MQSVIRVHDLRRSAGHRITSVALGKRDSIPRAERGLGHSLVDEVLLAKHHPGVPPFIATRLDIRKTAILTDLFVEPGVNQEHHRVRSEALQVRTGGRHGLNLSRPVAAARVFLGQLLDLIQVLDVQVFVVYKVYQLSQLQHPGGWGELRCEAAGVHISINLNHKSARN